VFRVTLSTLLKFANEIVGDADKPILDVACGAGRNAVALAMLGACVTGVDANLTRLRTLATLGARYVAERTAGREGVPLYTVCADLDAATWPFAKDCLSAVVCVHFLKLGLLANFEYSLVPGGYLYLETFGGHGGNYIDLPLQGQIRELLSGSFHLKYYKERRVGPVHQQAVSVKLLARRN